MARSAASIRAALRRAKSQARAAQRKFEHKARGLEREARNPQIEVRCGCGYRFTRRANSMPKCCPSCNSVLVFY